MTKVAGKKTFSKLVGRTEEMEAEHFVRQTAVNSRHQIKSHVHLIVGKADSKSFFKKKEPS